MDGERVPAVTILLLSIFHLQAGFIALRYASGTRQS